MTGFAAQQIEALQAKLSARNVRTRREDGRELSYIEGWHAIAEANRVFGFDGWDRVTVSAAAVWQGRQGGLPSCAYVARVRIRVRAGDRVIVREGSGAGHGTAPSAGAAHERALKEAETDATKRALATFGNIFGLALYDRAQKGVRKEAQRRPAAPGRVQEAPLTLALSATNIEVFHRPEGWCSAFRKILELTGSPDELMAFWKANEKTVAQLRADYPKLATAKGVHYAQILGELYTERLQAFARRLVAVQPSNLNPLMRPRIDKSGFAIPVERRLRDRAHLRYVAAHPCLVCGRLPAHAHHLRHMQPRALSRKVSDAWTVPLCALHHRALHDAGDEPGWWAARQLDPAETAARLWSESRGDAAPETGEAPAPAPGEAGSMAQPGEAEERPGLASQAAE